MYDLESRLDFLGKLLKCSQLSLWKFDTKLNIINSTCENPDFCHNLFIISSIGEQALLQFENDKSNRFLQLTDTYGLSWMIAPLYIADTLSALYAIGPAFFNSISNQLLSEKLRNSSISIAQKTKFIEQISKFPVVSLNYFPIFASMLVYSITGEYVSPKKETISSANSNPMPSQSQISAKQHGNYVAEQLFLEAIKTGNLDALKQIRFTGETGCLSLDDPLRAIKNQGIVLITLSTRAAISGGLPDETAFNLSDQTILKIESSKSINETGQIMVDYVHDIITRVHRLHLSKEKRRDILLCYDYIESHLEENINYEHMSKTLGYSRNYLSVRFKKQTGITLSTAINNCKIERAKTLLKHDNLTVQEISERLCYSSPSYFTSIFRKKTGMTPSEYKQQGYFHCDTKKTAYPLK